MVSVMNQRSEAAERYIGALRELGASPEVIDAAERVAAVQAEPPSAEPAAGPSATRPTG